jgi:hypothetical protein
MATAMLVDASALRWRYGTVDMARGSETIQRTDGNIPGGDGNDLLAVVGRSRSWRQAPMVGMGRLGMGGRAVWCGERALARRGITTLRQPFDPNSGVGWDDVATLVEFACCGEDGQGGGNERSLGIAPSEHPLCLVEPPLLGGDAARSKMTEKLFEELSVPSLALLRSSELVARAAGGLPIGREIAAGRVIALEVDYTYRHAAATSLSPLGDTVDSVQAGVAGEGVMWGLSTLLGWDRTPHTAFEKGGEELLDRMLRECSLTLEQSDFSDGAPGGEGGETARGDGEHAVPIAPDLAVRAPEVLFDSSLVAELWDGISPEPGPGLVDAVLQLAQKQTDTAAPTTVLLRGMATELAGFPARLARALRDAGLDVNALVPITPSAVYTEAAEIVALSAVQFVSAETFQEEGASAFRRHRTPLVKAARG